MIRTCLFAWVAIMMIPVSHGMADMDAPPSYKKVMQIVNSTELTKEQKVARLKELAVPDETRMIALIELASLDSREATQTAMGIFRAKDTPREVKLRLGHFLLEGNRPQKKGFSKGFVEEFAQYLIGAILDGGEKEFNQKLDGLSPTAVGEYAYLASDFNGYKNVDFTSFKDARVVPVLIRCLNAPDDVYPKDQGDNILGKPGESTGRNTARQQIPIALAKLGDERAIEPLKTVLFKHTDIYGRMNAAYALARLLQKKEDRAVIGKEILAQKELLWCRLPFGRGLIEGGDDAGVEFLAIKHAGGYGRLEYPSEIFYMINQRLSVLKGFKSPKVEDFLRESLGFKPLRAMLLFEPGSVKISGAAYLKPPKDEAEALENTAPQIIEIYGAMLDCIKTNKLKGLSADLEDVAKNTRNEKIRQMTRTCLKSLAD